MKQAAACLEERSDTMSWGRVRGVDGGLERLDADAPLVQAARDGDSASAARLIERYQDKIYTLVYSHVPNREDALDLTQEIFVKALRGLSGFRAESGFYTWLYRIAVRHCIDFSRRRQRNGESLRLDTDALAELGVEPADPAPGSDPERMVISRQLRVAIQKGLATVAEPFRTAVVLHDIDGLSQEEIARLMGCPLGTAKSRIQRGRAQLRRLLSAYVEPGD
jgi:RNA polymerase sigma-70 factor (ECF subfamily)